MSTNNVENNQNKTISEQNGEECDQTVIQTQPKTDETQQKQKLSSTEELALLGLRPNSDHSDPCLCFCCIFCLEACLTPTGGAPPVPPHKRMVRKVVGLHNWDNDSHDEYNDDNDGDGTDWAVLANHVLNNDGDGHAFGGHGHDSGDGGHDGGDGGGDGGGGGGGGDGGGGE